MKKIATAITMIIIIMLINISPGYGISPETVDLARYLRALVEPLVIFGDISYAFSLASKQFYSNRSAGSGSRNFSQTHIIPRCILCLKKAEKIRPTTKSVKALHRKFLKLMRHVYVTMYKLSGIMKNTSKTRSGSFSSKLRKLKKTYRIEIKMCNWVNSALDLCKRLKVGFKQELEIGALIILQKREQN